MCSFLVQGGQGVCAWCGDYLPTQSHGPDEAGLGVHADNVQRRPAESGSLVSPVVEAIDARLMDARSALHGQAAAPTKARITKAFQPCG